MTGTATVRDVVVGAVLAPLLLVVLSVTVRIGCAVVGAVSILIEMAVVRIVPALAPVGRTARDIVSGLSVLGVALFVVGGVVGLLLMGWRAL